MENKPIVISSNAGLIDGIQSAARTLVILATAIPIMLSFLSKHDLVGMIGYLQSVEGAQVIATMTGLGTIAYGIYKSHKRGVQVANVARDIRVPAEVASLKGTGL